LAPVDLADRACYIGALICRPAQPAIEDGNMVEIKDELKGLRRFRDEILNGRLQIRHGDKDQTVESGRQLDAEIQHLEAVLRRLKDDSKT
jgi:hypothetical protein